MTEPRVEAGDRALETARKINSRYCTTNTNVTVAECAAMIQSAMNAQEWELVEALREAKVRLGICLGRMRACEAGHEVSLEEIPAWIEDTERLLAERGGKQ